MGWRNGGALSRRHPVGAIEAWLSPCLCGQLAARCSGLTAERVHLLCALLRTPGRSASSSHLRELPECVNRPVAGRSALTENWIRPGCSGKSLNRGIGNASVAAQASGQGEEQVLPPGGCNPSDGGVFGNSLNAGQEASQEGDAVMADMDANAGASTDATIGLAKDVGELKGIVHAQMTAISNQTTAAGIHGPSVVRQAETAPSLPVELQAS